MNLVTIDSRGHQADAGAAASLARMRAAGMPAGNVTSAYRSPAEQAVLRAKYLAGTGAFALPVGQSVHESGLAIDFVSPQYTWLAAHGAEHGWHNPTIGKKNYERWHYEYVAANDRHINDTAPVAEKEWDEMATKDDIKAAVREVLAEPGYRNAVSSTDVLFTALAGFYHELLGRPARGDEIRPRYRAVVAGTSSLGSQYDAIYASDEAKKYRAAK